MKPKTNPILMDRLAAAAKEGKISRRSFMYNSMAAGVTASAATGLWTTSAKAEPKRGGLFRIGQHDGNTSDQHDPGKYVSFADIALAPTFRSYLTMINPDQSLGGDLATEWSASPDATEWTFKLNKNATFHSGKKVTSEDVIATLNHHRGEDTTSAVAAFFTDVTEIVADGDHTVIIRLAAPNADLPWIMPDYHMAICPANPDGTLNWQSADGSGPYKLVEFEPGVQARLVRHDDWHGEGAYFDEVLFLYINDPNARQTALVTGDVDAVSLLENKTMSLLERDPNLVVDNVSSAQAITLAMHVDQAPFDNNDVRMALKLAIDREEIIDKITFGAATIGNDFHHAPSMPYFPSEIPQREYDPEQAAALWKKTGLGDTQINISTAESITTGAVDAMVLYAEHAKAAGINLNVVREPNDGYWSDVWLKKPFCMVTWGARPTPDVMYSLTYKKGAPWNETHWENERFNEVLVQAKGELDDAKRAEMYHEMGMLMRDDGGTVLPYFPNFVSGRRKNVQHIGQLAGSWSMDGGRAASRWWFEG
ncbi:putative D,D-dipeptide-binding periplasmic protein DdpA precursor [Roseovarius albus]|uniref:Putative D,D-dipeptide-binding periplasmic protein DdpA n=1 Tax=Roseovarius albus TaxID=1247867 RepID=A0A1X6ZX06_9RHOB|nr:ABC transporter substrate-binding protein [Roseovarius albus]SLN64195.1 putative D,D-dipeptide-binding periplasmic protein DdpA precursor [Roseovarius albus]